MKNIFGMYTSEDDEREYEESLEKDIENNHLHPNHKKLNINKNSIQSREIFLTSDITQAKKLHN